MFEGLSDAEFERASTLASRITDLEFHRSRLDDRVLMKYPRLQQRVKNVSFLIDEGDRIYRKFYDLADDTQKILLDGARATGIRAGAIPRSLPKLSPTPLPSARSAAQTGLRTAAAVAKPLAIGYEAYRLGRNIGDYGLVGGAQESIGTIGGEFGDITQMAGSGLQQARRLDPIGMNPAVQAIAGMGDMLSYVGSFMSKAHSYGPADDEDDSVLTEQIALNPSGE